jgi:hypothetical protein
MPIKRCEVCGKGFSQGRGRPSKRCPACRPGGGRYGGAHKKLVAETRDQAYGRACCRCGGVMLRGQELHLDHADGGGPADYRGWAHAHCNESAAATRGNRMRGQNGRPVIPVTPAVVPGAVYGAQVRAEAAASGRELPAFPRHSPDCLCGGSVVWPGPGRMWTSRCWVAGGRNG